MNTPPDQMFILGEDFLAFVVTRQSTNQLRFYALTLDSRAGALPDSKRYLTLPTSIKAPSALERQGPYTVLQSYEALTIFGNPTRPK